MQLEVNPFAPVSYLKLVRMQTVEKNDIEKEADVEIMRNLKDIA